MHDQKAGARQLRLDLVQPSSHARDEFIVSDTNRLVVEAIEAWPKWPGGRLVVVGPSGSGKTHLAQAWATRVGAISSMAGSGHAMTTPLLLDDADQNISDEALFHAFNRADGGATLLLTGRTPPSRWRTRLPDLRSRLNALTVANLGPPDDDVLLGVLDKLFRERNIRPASGVSSYVIRRMERSVPAAKAIVEQIDQYAGEEKREVTLAVAREILGRTSTILDSTS